MSLSSMFQLLTEIFSTSIKTHMMCFHIPQDDRSSVLSVSVFSTATSLCYLLMWTQSIPLQHILTLISFSLMYVSPHYNSDLYSLAFLFISLTAMKILNKLYRTRGALSTIRQITPSHRLILEHSQFLEHVRIPVIFY